MGKKHLILLICAALIIVIPYALNVENNGGTDDVASIEMEKSGYTPWFKSPWKPPKDEMENLLFGAQAAVGLIIIALFVGYYRQKSS